jgi:hypothetical protein
MSFLDEPSTEMDYSRDIHLSCVSPQTKTCDQHYIEQTLDEVMANCKDILQKKGKDYSQDQNRFSNFERAADDCGISVFQAWLVFFSKHYFSIGRFCKEQIVYSEPIEGRIYDAINYLVILLAMIKKHKNKNSNIENEITMENLDIEKVFVSSQKDL